MSTEHNPHDTKEIDLLDVTGRAFSGLGYGIRLFFGWIKYMIQGFFYIFWKYVWILSALLIIGATAGYVKARLQKPYYQTEMLVETQVVSRVQIADRINNLQLLIKDGNNSSLARQLNISNSDVNTVFFIKADIVNVKVDAPKKRVIDKDGKEYFEEELGPQFMRIRVRVWDNRSIVRLEQALVSFIENDPYISERVRISKQNNQRQQEAIQMEIDQLVLFQKKNIEKSSSVMTSGNTPLMVQNDEKTYVPEILELKNQKLALEAAYELVKPMTVVQPFSPFENPVNRLVINILIFAMLAFAAGYTFLLLHEGWKRV